MSDEQADATPIFDFMVVRAPEPVPQRTMRRHYIRDGEFLRRVTKTHVPPPPTLEEYSKIGALVFRHVFRTPLPEEPMDELQEDLLKLVGGATVQLPGNEDEENGDDEGDHPQAETGAESPYLRLRLARLDGHAVILRDGVYHVLPDQLGDHDLPYLAAVRRVLAVHRAVGTSTPDAAAAIIRGAFGENLIDVVFSHEAGGHHPDYVSTVRGLFEALYLLYVLRRWVSVDLGDVIDGLRILHLLEALAIDELLSQSRPPVSSGDAELVAMLARYYPALATWDGETGPAGFPLVSTEEDVLAYLGAQPVVHPIFARLFNYRNPYNDLKPLGVGDFKVVKQWLVGYVPGEICDIHNIMKGESKERTHRRLEKAEETFQFSSSTEEETSRDTQTTDRFELKREVEATLKTDLNVNANTNVQYKGAMVLATVAGGFAYNRSESSVEKVAQNFSREVVAKAVSRVQNRAAQERSITKVFETEETNKHTLTSKDAHVAGIYRWVDKRYRAQLFNYGRRMMFEFVLPEPAAFLVEQRLRAFEAELDVPQPPKQPVYETVVLPFAAHEIDPVKFDELRRTYDLEAFTFPALSRRVALVNQETGQAFFSEKGIDADDTWWSRTYHCKLDAGGYQVAKVRFNGSIYWRDETSSDDIPDMRWRDRNLFSVALGGATIGQSDHSGTRYKAMYTPNDDIDLRTSAFGQPYVLAGETLDLVLGFQEISNYHLEVFADLELTDSAKLTWQISVHKAVLLQEQRRVDEINRERRLAYDSAMSTYRSRVDELRGTVLNELLQGTSEAANAELIRTELRRQCLAAITKELTATPATDLITTWEALGTRKVERRVTRLQVDEDVTSAETSVSWKSTNESTDYPVPDLDITRRKGRHVQFLEQAFDWDNLAFLFHPHFWATPGKWVELMSRTDDTDARMTAFLRAGSVRVLVAVTPAYDQAVLHFLATGEPWEGGASPAVGDPLYLPLHEELRQQQDDLYGAQAEGDAWEFTVPTSLVYLHGSETPLPDLVAERKARQEQDGGRRGLG